MSVAIRIENLGKKYRVNHAVDRVEYQTLREAIGQAALAPWRRLRRGPSEHCEDFWALRDINLDVAHGEAVGIIGRNGAGKSTLLKILSQITKPTTGCIKLYGRVASLLEVGTGFHPELTGRENVFLNGSILGMSRAEIQRKFDEIVDFSGVERFLDTPIKRFSSGMKVRLAFAVAAHLEPEILVVDEVLAVGDAEFQKKCLGKMSQVATSGRTVLFVSHSMPAVRSLTTQAAYLVAGQLKAYGATSATIAEYLEDSVHLRSQSNASLTSFRRHSNDGKLVRLLAISIEELDDDGAGLPVVASTEDIAISLEIEADEQIPRACISVTLVKDQEERVATIFSPDVSFAPSLKKGRQQVVCVLRGLPLSPGRYSVSVGINQCAETRAFDCVVDVPMFEVVLEEGLESIEWPNRPWGVMHLRDVEWSIQRERDH